LLLLTKTHSHSLLLSQYSNGDLKNNNNNNQQSVKLSIV
jgi:hypothetical protein